MPKPGQMNAKHYALAGILIAVGLPVTRKTAVQPFIASAGLEFIANYVLFPGLLFAFIYLAFVMKWKRVGGKRSFEALYLSRARTKLEVAFKFAYVLLSLVFASWILPQGVLLYAAWPQDLLASDRFSKVVRIVSISDGSAPVSRNYIYVEALDSETGQKINFYWPKDQEAKYFFNPSSFPLPTRCLSGRRSALGFWIEKARVICKS